MRLSGQAPHRPGVAWDIVAVAPSPASSCEWESPLAFQARLAVGASWLGSVIGSACFVAYKLGLSLLSQ